MRNIRIYTPQTLNAAGDCVLDAAPSHHLAIVLRARVDQPIELFNGDGNAYAARITAISKKAVAVIIDACTKTDNESPLQRYFQGRSVRSRAAEKHRDWRNCNYAIDHRAHRSTSRRRTC